MFCHKCGATAQIEAKYCGACGTELASDVVNDRDRVPQRVPWKSAVSHCAVFIAAAVAMSFLFSLLSRQAGILVIENTPLMAVTLTIGYFSLGSPKRHNISTKVHLVIFASYIPLVTLAAMFAHDAKFRNPESLASITHLVFTVLTAVLAYNIAARKV